MGPASLLLKCKVLRIFHPPPFFNFVRSCYVLLSPPNLKESKRFWTAFYASFSSSSLLSTPYGLWVIMHFARLHLVGNNIWKNSCFVLCLSHPLLFQIVLDATMFFFTRIPPSDSVLLWLIDISKTTIFLTFFTNLFINNNIKEVIKQIKMTIIWNRILFFNPGRTL